MNRPENLAVISLLTGFLLLEGCSTTRTLTFDRPSAHGKLISLNAAKRQTEGKSVKIRFQDGSELNGRMISLTRDSVLMTPESGERSDTAISLYQVASLRTRNHNAGAMIGLTWGLISGTGVFIATAVAGWGLTSVYAGGAWLLGGIIVGTLDGPAESIEIPQDSIDVPNRASQKEVRKE